ncbi:hypothetical protein V1524DRAFT_479013 [Lipomyces starkeyi]
MAPNFIPGLPEPVPQGGDKFSIACPVCDQILTELKGTQSDREHKGRMRVRLVSHVKGLARNSDVAHQGFLERYNENKATVKLPRTAQEIHRQIERKRKERKRQEAIASEAIERQEAIKASGTDDYWRRYLPGATMTATRIVQSWLENYYTDDPSVSPLPESVLAPPTKNTEHLFALLESSGFSLLASLPVKTRYTIREINDHLDAVRKTWPWEGTFERFVQKVIHVSNKIVENKWRLMVNDTDAMQLWGMSSTMPISRIPESRHEDGRTAQYAAGKKSEQRSCKARTC